MGDYPYEEYFLTQQELNVLKDQNALVYMMWELVYHFHIGVDITRLKGAFVWHKKWVKYFFTNLDR